MFHGESKVFNQKINCMRASGYFLFDGKRYEFNPTADFGTLDWGRGVWTYDNTWYWGSGNADINGNSFGFNIGYGFGNTSAATENVIFYNGKVHKLDDVTFHIPETGYMAPWTFTSWLQKRTWTANYETIRAICSKGQRRNHKLTEWNKSFIDWAWSLPYAKEFIFDDLFEK